MDACKHRRRRSAAHVYLILYANTPPRRLLPITNARPFVRPAPPRDGGLERDLTSVSSGGLALKQSSSFTKPR